MRRPTTREWRGGLQRSVSRVLFRDPVSPTAVMIIPLGPPLPTGSGSQPGDLERAARIAPLSGLAPDGVCLAGPVTRAAGALLPHPFNLTNDPRGGRPGLHLQALGDRSPRALQRATRTRTWRSALCCTFLRVTPTGRYPAPCSAELGLSSRPPSSDDAPTSRPRHLERGDRRSPVPLERRGPMQMRRPCRVRPPLPRPREGPSTPRRPPTLPSEPQHAPGHDSSKT